MLDHVICMHHIFIVSGTSMYFSFYLQWDVGSSPSVERWCVLLSSSSVERRCISLQYLQWNVGLCYRYWYGDTYLSTSSGTLVVHLQWNVGVFCYLHRQWNVDVYLFMSSVVRWYISLHIISGTVVYLSSYHQWYGGISLFISSVVRWYISLHI